MATQLRRDPPPAMSQSIDVPERPIIFFDGVCGICNRFVDTIVRADTSDIFRFASLQGESARELLPALPDDPGQWSVVYLDEWGLHDQSEASLRVFRRLGGVWWFLSLALFVPRLVRDPIYRSIARNRYRWFGRRDRCRVPSQSERRRFLL